MKGLCIQRWGVSNDESSLFSQMVVSNDKRSLSPEMGVSKDEGSLCPETGFPMMRGLCDQR